jgi:hypothetical protein
MPTAVDDLLTVEGRLDRAFGVAVVAFLVYTFWPLALRVMGLERQAWVDKAGIALLGILLATYVWFAYAAAAAAGRVARSRVLVAAWVLLAPILSLLPIPIVSQLIAASPLSLKFILAGELRSAIHEKTLAD